MTKLAELYETENWTNLGRDITSNFLYWKSLVDQNNRQIQMVTQKKFISDTERVVLQHSGHPRKLSLTINIKRAREHQSKSKNL